MTKSVIASGQILAFVQRIERMEKERKSLSAGIAEVYAEAKNFGFETKVLREVVKLRKLDAVERFEHDMVLRLYESAL